MIQSPESDPDLSRLSGIAALAISLVFVVAVVIGVI